jgi:cell wall-associated NlpC family hydrolase
MIVRHFTTLLACALLALAPAAQAAPEAQRGDAVLQLLQERGLLPSQVADQVAGNTQALVRQVRDRASDLVISAFNFLGVPYRRGGNGPDQGFDCSGFTRHIFEHSLGLILPRRADQQANEAGLEPVDKNELKPGDLVFFNTMKRAFSHVGIYVGDGKFIHSPRSGGQVRVEDMREAYWAKRFNGARRAETEAAAMPTAAAAATPTPAAPAPQP